MREHAADPLIRDYEMMVVVTPTVTEDGLQPVIDRISGYIATQNGTVDSTNSQNPWGRRRLAYQIQDHLDAFYVLYRFHALPDQIIEIEREIKLDEQVIRYLVVKYDVMTEHEERPQGGRRGEAPAAAREGSAPTPAPQPQAQAEPAAAAPEAAEPEAATPEAAAPEAAAPEAAAPEAAAPEASGEADAVTSEAEADSAEQPEAEAEK